MPGRKKKAAKDTIPLAKPEPPIADDRELAMLWDKVAPLGPNPFAPASHPSLYVGASAAISAGPLSGAGVVPIPPATARPGVGTAVPTSANGSAPGGTGSAPLANPSAPSHQDNIPMLTARPGGGGQSSIAPTLQDQEIPASGINSRVYATLGGHASSSPAQAVRVPRRSVNTVSLGQRDGQTPRDYQGRGSRLPSGGGETDLSSPRSPMSPARGFAAGASAASGTTVHHPLRPAVDPRSMPRPAPFWQDSAEGTTTTTTEPWNGPELVPRSTMRRIPAPVERLHEPVTPETLAQRKKDDARKGRGGDAPEPVVVSDPSRHQAALNLYRCETAYRTAQMGHEAADREARDLAGAVGQESHQFLSRRKTLARDIEGLEARRQQEHAAHTRALEEGEAAFNMARHRLEDDIATQLERRDRVSEALAHKRETLDQISSFTTQKQTLKITHQQAVTDLKRQLTQRLNVLEKTMLHKLKRTTDDMAALTADQHAARRERAELERDRLTTELQVAERRCRQLAARARKLTVSTDSLRRDTSLEDERHEFLAKKNASLARNLHTLVGELTGVERSFAAAAAAKSGSPDPAGGTPSTLAMAEEAAAEGADETPATLAGVIDRQYEIIVHLRRDLSKLQSDIGTAEARLHGNMQRTVATSATNSRTIAAEPKSNDAFATHASKAVQSAVRDLTVAFRGAGRTLENVSAEERASLLDYIVRRVNSAVLESSLKPRLPPQTLQEQGSTGRLRQSLHASGTAESQPIPLLLPTPSGTADPEV